MHTYPLAVHMGPMEAGRWDQVADLLLASAHVLRGAGADFLICPDNTAHQAIDLIRSRSPLPWLHIAEEVATGATGRGFHRLLLLGTKYLMEGPVYASKLGPRGIEYRVPDLEDRRRLNALIFTDLVYGRFEDAGRAFLQELIAAGKADGAEAVVLGCTELPLLIDDVDSPLPVLDSTRILARSALRHAVTE
jgi:aspartate racemase